MFGEAWRATQWTLEHPSTDSVILREERHTAAGMLYHLEIEAPGGNSSALSFEAESERQAKKKAMQEVHAFLELASGRTSWAKTIGRRR